MTILTIYDENNPNTPEFVSYDENIIAQQLDKVGIRYECWTTDVELSENADQTSIIAAYSRPIERLKNIYGFQSVDVVSINTDNPKKEEMRSKFITEHTHSDFEVRFFVEGQGLFFMRPNDKVYALLCEQGDLISVPSDTHHWYDMGAFPDFKCIRLFSTTEGWLAKYTGDNIAASFPTLEQFVEKYEDR